MVTDITTTLLAAFNAIIGGIGTGIVDLFEVLLLQREAGIDTILFTSDDTFSGLNTFGIWIFALMGVGLAIGVFTRLLNKVA